MEECAGIAEVIRVTKHPVVEIAEGVEVGGYTFYARMYAPADKYLHDLFLVKFSKPSEFASFQHEKGFKMEFGVAKAAEIALHVLRERLNRGRLGNVHRVGTRCGISQQRSRFLQTGNVYIGERELRTDFRQVHRQSAANP